MKYERAETACNKQIREDSASKMRYHLKTLPKTKANKPMTNHRRISFFIFLAFSRE
jgi:hypothetical protein